MIALTPEAFAQDWIEEFNTHDVERILAHYAPEVELISPVYLRFSRGRSDTVRGHPALRDYFTRALQLYPDLRFTLLEVAAGALGVALRYHTNLGDRVAVECFEGRPVRPRWACSATTSKHRAHDGAAEGGRLAGRRSLPGLADRASAAVVRCVRVSCAMRAAGRSPPSSWSATWA